MNLIHSRAQELLDALESTKAELSILLTDDSEIRELNHRYRGIDSATDVLSFPMGEEELLGDVVISVETASRQAGDDGHGWRLTLQAADSTENLDEAAPSGPGATWGLEEELTFLLVHGVLHLVGWVHETPHDDAAMRQRERELFTALTSPS